MAKRRTKRAEQLAKKREARKLITIPKGQSRYALTRKGQYQPTHDPARRPSWFVRSGLAARAERALDHDRIDIA